MPSPVLAPLLYEIFSSLTKVELDNVDYWRNPELQPRGLAKLLEWVRERMVLPAQHLRFVDLKRYYPGHAATTLAPVLEDLGGYERTYALIETPECRALLLKLIAFRSLTNRFVRLPQNTPEYRRLRRKLEHGAFRDRSLPPLKTAGFLLWMYDLDAAGFPMRLWAHPMNVLNTFLLQQYRCRRQPASVFVRPGDLVIDGGGGDRKSTRLNSSH